MNKSRSVTVRRRIGKAEYARTQAVQQGRNAVRAAMKSKIFKALILDLEPGKRTIVRLDEIGVILVAYDSVSGKLGKELARYGYLRGGQSKLPKNKRIHPAVQGDHLAL